MPKLIDLTGQRFGWLVVKSRAGSSKFRAATWLCVCECGNEKVIVGASLCNGYTNSCGCLQNLQIIDLAGQRFGRLVVKHQSGYKHGSVAWFCECDCGRTCVVGGAQLRNGNTKSCGCLRRDIRLQSIHGHTVNGCVTRTYCSWVNLIQRCTNPKRDNFKYYGERGTTVCARWRFGEHGKSGFECFLEDMGERPAGKTIDRINAYGIYEPANCQWATWAEQVVNRRRLLFGTLAVTELPDTVACS